MRSRRICAQPRRAIGAFVGELAMRDAGTQWGEHNTLGLWAGEDLVAGAVYNHHSAHDVMLSVAGRGPYWLTPLFLFALFDYPFNQLGRERVSALARTDNTRSITLLRHAGFRPEGYVRKIFGDADGILFGMLKGECKWISNTFCERWAKCSSKH